MLKKLTTEQKAKMLEIKNFWLDRVFSCTYRVNKDEAIKNLEWIYKCCGYEKPLVLFTGSPMGSLYAANLLMTASAHNVDEKVISSIEETVSNIKDLPEKLIKSFKPHSPSSYINIKDYGWVAFYDFFSQIGILKNEKFNNYKQLLLSGIYSTIQFDKVCIVSDMPTKILRDDAKRLHAERGSAISFGDGYEQFFWHGINVPKSWIMDKESLTKADVMNEKNVEKRRCLQEILGSDGFARLLDLSEIDRDQDNYGKDMILYKTKSPDELAGDFLYFLSVTCPSTDRKYMLCVEKCANVWAAKAQTFKNKKIEFRHGDIGLLNLSKEFSKPIFES